MSFDRQAARALFNNPESRIPTPPDRTTRRTLQATPDPTAARVVTPRTAAEVEAEDNTFAQSNLYDRLNRKQSKGPVAIVLPVVLVVGLVAGAAVLFLPKGRTTDTPAPAAVTTTTTTTPAPTPVAAAMPAPTPVERAATPAPAPIAAAPARPTATVRPARPAARAPVSRPRASTTIPEPTPVNPPATASAPSEPAPIVLPPPLPTPAPEPTAPQ